MSKWFRGRNGRPTARIISLVALVSLLVLQLAPLAYAQPDLSDVASFFGQESSIATPTPVVIMDFNNESKHQTGMLGRTFADALTIELLNTRVFDVVKRQRLEQVLNDTSLSMPMPMRDYQAQAMLADRLQAKYTINGDVSEVNIVKGRDGTYAEVTVRTVVVSKVTRTPISGAIIKQNSSPKIGYSGSSDVLVQEALAIAAYNTAQTLMNTRLPIATVLISPRNGEIILRGGSSIGFRKGMELITIRRETVTGRLRLMSVTPSDSIGIVVDESVASGIAPGDRAVPVYSFESGYEVTDEETNNSLLKIAGYGLLAALATLVSSNGGSADVDAGPTPAVTPLADAYSMSEPRGANLLRWERMGDRVVAYVIYRDNNTFIPIDVVDGNTTYYIDSASELPELGMVAEEITVNCEIDEETGLITSFTREVDYTDDVTAANGELTVDESSFDATCYRTPLNPGQTVGYVIRTIYMDFQQKTEEDELGHPEGYQLYLGKLGGNSPRVTLISPPILASPVDNQFPDDGIYSCYRVPAATQYQLQLSSEPTFQAGTTHNIVAELESDTVARATYLTSDLYSNAKFTYASTIFWRVGARLSGQPSPDALSDASQDNWVYSPIFSFLKPLTPPGPTMMRMRDDGTPGLPGKSGGPSGRTDDRRIMRMRY